MEKAEKILKEWKEKGVKELDSGFQNSCYDTMYKKLIEFTLKKAYEE